MNKIYSVFIILGLLFVSQSFSSPDIAIDIIVNISEDEMTLIDEKGLKYINKRVKE